MLKSSLCPWVSGIKFKHRCHRCKLRDDIKLIYLPTLQKQIGNTFTYICKQNLKWEMESLHKTMCLHAHLRDLWIKTRGFSLQREGSCAEHKAGKSKPSSSFAFSQFDTVLVTVGVSLLIPCATEDWEGFVKSAGRRSIREDVSQICNLNVSCRLQNSVTQMGLSDQFS